MNLFDLGLGNVFLDMTPKAQATKDKIDTLDFIKIKHLMCFKRHYSEKVKRQTKEWEEIFANCV